MSSVEEIHSAAIALPQADRVALIGDLLDSVAIDHHEVSDVEVFRRKQKWDEEKVEGVSWEAVKRNGGR